MPICTLSIAGLATALAAVATAENCSSGSKMSRAVASATELLASLCIEIAEQAGADHDRVAIVVRSAVDVKSPGDLMTLTGASATALRAEAALRARLPKDAKRIGAISPYDKGLRDANSIDAYHSESEEHKFPCVGELMQHAKKGGLRWKQVTAYINKKSEVIHKLKSKHVGGAFSKKDKCRHCCNASSCLSLPVQLTMCTSAGWIIFLLTIVSGRSEVLLQLASRQLSLQDFYGNIFYNCSY